MHRSFRYIFGVDSRSLSLIRPSLGPGMCLSRNHCVLPVGQVFRLLLYFVFPAELGTYPFPGGEGCVVSSIPWSFVTTPQFFNKWITLPASAALLQLPLCPYSFIKTLNINWYIIYTTCIQDYLTQVMMSLSSKCSLGGGAAAVRLHVKSPLPQLLNPWVSSSGYPGYRL